MSRTKPLPIQAEETPSSNGSSRASSRKKRRSRKHDDSSDDEWHSAQSAISSTSDLPALTLEHLSLASESPMPLLGGATKRVLVFVASLGNPKPYLNTLHSAGHTVLNAIAKQQQYGPWSNYAGGQIAEASDRQLSFLTGYAREGEARPTLWKCGSLMNVSGPAVKKAFAKWKQENRFSDDEQPRLVIVHDELEKELGAVNVRTDPKASARGHNGLKSLMASLPHERFIRIGVGIGRPDSRERDAVSNYVLRNIKGNEVAALEQAARRVEQQIAEIHEGNIA